MLNISSEFDFLIGPGSRFHAAGAGFQLGPLDQAFDADGNLLLEPTNPNANQSFDVAGPVTLNIGKSGANVTVSWKPGASLGTLQQAGAVTGPWTTVSNVYAPSYTVTPSPNSNKFFRLQLN